MNKPTPLSRRRLVDVVIDHFRAEIAQGALPAGSRLPPEGQLTVDLGVSRTTLREAVVVLSHDGLLDVRQGDGTYVTARPPERETVEQRLERASDADVLEVRRVLEPMAARLAAGRRTDDELAQLRLALAERDRARDQGERARVVEQEVEFRELVARASGNIVLGELVQTVARRGGRRDDETMPQLADLDPFSAMFGAIERADGEAAGRAAERIVELDGGVVRVRVDELATRVSAAPDNRRGPRVKRANP